MHDKSPVVCVAAFRSVLAPFEVVRDASEGKAREVGAEHLMVERIDLGSMEHVSAKFWGRISGAVTDPVGEVQEANMSIMLRMHKDGFIDEVQDNELWYRTNQRSLAYNTVST